MNPYTYPGIVGNPQIRAAISTPHTTDALIERIELIVCDAFDVEKKEIHQKNRKEIYVRPRMLAMYLIKHNTHLTLTMIGVYFKKDHSTVSHALVTVENLIWSDKEFRQKVTMIKNLLSLK